MKQVWLTKDTRSNWCVNIDNITLERLGASEIGIDGEGDEVFCTYYEWEGIRFIVDQLELEQAYTSWMSKSQAERIVGKIKKQLELSDSKRGLKH